MTVGIRPSLAQYQVEPSPIYLRRSLFLLPITMSTFSSGVMAAITSSTVLRLSVGAGSAAEKNKRHKQKRR